MTVSVALSPAPSALSRMKSVSTWLGLMRDAADVVGAIAGGGAVCQGDEADLADAVSRRPQPYTTDGQLKAREIRKQCVYGSAGWLGDGIAHIGDFVRWSGSKKGVTGDRVGAHPIVEMPSLA